MQNQDYHRTGIPEYYLTIPENTELDTDALSCVLKRASAISVMLGSSLDEDGNRPNDEILSNACWALDGMLKQALVLVGEDIS